jgi:hypothetical protein
MTRTHIYLVIAIAACGASGGCGAKPDATVQGTVTIDGELANRGTVVFHPVESGPPAYGTIDQNGTYSLRVGQGDLKEADGGRLHSGEYIATVVVNMLSSGGETLGPAGPPMPGPRLTAAKYADKNTSDLRITVKPGLNIVPLELEGAASEEASAPEVGAKPQEGNQSVESGEGAPETPSGHAPAAGAKAAPPAEAAPAEAAPAKAAPAEADGNSGSQGGPSADDSREPKP